MKSTRDPDRQPGKPTIADVAKAAGVSRATAARVMGGYGYAGKDVRKRVLGAAKKLAYQPNEIARSMATGRSKTIGIVVADIENLYFARAIRAVTDTARKHNFGIILANTDENIELERTAVRTLLANRVDGLIVAPTSSVEVDHLVAARDSGCPVVLLDRRVPVLDADTYAVDNFSAAHEAVQSLISHGHRRIALVSNAPAHGEQQYLISSVRERIDGYRAALREASIPVTPNRTVLGGWNADNLARQLVTLCRSPMRPTAFLATDSSVALVLVQVFRELDLSMPGDVSLICFDDAEWTTAMTPPLTVVSQPIRDMAQAATETLIARLDGKAVSESREVLLKAALIQRGSVGSPPAERDQDEAALSPALASASKP